MCVLVLGGTGYVGSNLMAALQDRTPGNIVQVARRASSYATENIDVDLSFSPLAANHRLFDLAPRHVFYLGRPCEQSYSAYRMFHTNVQQLCIAWLAKGSLDRIDFTSSTLVYPDQSTGRNFDARDLVPNSLYEYFKLETEMFLGYLQLQHPQAEINVWRLPPMFGGIVNAETVRVQFIYWFINQYRSSFAWGFPNDTDKTFGTSWGYIPDFIDQVLYSGPRAGATRNFSSGYFTFYHLHEFLRHIFPAAKEGTMRLLRSKLNVPDDTASPMREITTLISEYLRRFK